MKTKTILDLPENFDEVLSVNMDRLIHSIQNNLTDDINCDRQSIINLMRTRVHQAFKLGVEAGGKK